MQKMKCRQKPNMPTCKSATVYHNSSADIMKKLLVRADLSWHWENDSTEGQERHILAGIVGIGRQIPDGFAWIFGRQAQEV